MLTPVVTEREDSRAQRRAEYAERSLIAHSPKMFRSQREMVRASYLLCPAPVEKVTVIR